MLYCTVGWSVAEEVTELLVVAVLLVMLVVLVVAVVLVALVDVELLCMEQRVGQQ